MKKVLLYCDRCAQEQKDTVAATIVWIRTAGMPRTIRFDVCQPHLDAIIGAAPTMSTNGATAPAVRKGVPATWGPKSKVYQGLYERLLPFIAKTAVFSTDDLGAAFGVPAKSGSMRAVLSRLVDEHRLARVIQGVYRRQDVTIPEVTTIEDGVKVSLKLIQARPGTRSSVIAALAGIRAEKVWKPTLVAIKARGVKTKGTKSATRLYPPKS